MLSGAGERPFGGRPLRAALMAVAAVGLLAGLTGAWVLLGLPIPAAAVAFASVHGLLMAFGFLGTLVSLERAVALGRSWGYVAPAAAALGALSLVVGDTLMASDLFVVAGLAFVAVYVAFDRIERSLHGTVQAAGAVGWLGGAVLLAAGRPVSSIVPWLAAFLVLTIVGERLELSRIRRPGPGARRAFVLAVAVFSLGVLAGTVVAGPGVRLAGVGLVALGAWLLRYDLAGRTIRAAGVTRFIAASLLPGYVWLAVAGFAWLALGPATSGSAYDVSLHALFLGFVMSMVFGHAPVILPAVLGVALPYRPRFYGHLLLLHLGLLVRIVGGDIVGLAAAWQLGGALNVTALLVFLASSGLAMVQGRRARRETVASSS